MPHCFHISRSSIRRESRQLGDEPSMLYKGYPDVACDQHVDEEQFYPVSFSPNGEQKFSMLYNKATWGRADDVVEMTTCVVEPSLSYVVDSCNLSNDSEMDHVPVMDSGTLPNGVNGKVSPPNTANLCNDSEMDHVPVMDSGTHENGVTGKVSPPNASNLSDDSEMDHAPAMDSGTLDNGVNGKVSPPNIASFSMESACEFDQQQHIRTPLPISEIFYEDENYNKRSSTHSASSEEVPSPDYPFLRVCDTSLPAAPIKVQPPAMPPSKLLNKKGSKENGDSDVNPNSAAAAAMKEAMEFAEARLKAAKELMGRKGGSFKLRKKPAHHRSTTSAEIKESIIRDGVNLFEEKLNMRVLAKEENQKEDLSFLDKNSDAGAMKFVHRDPDKKMILPLGKPQEIPQNRSKQEQLGKWMSDAEFYELIGHDQECRPDAVPCEENNSITNSLTNLDLTEKENTGGFACEPKRSRKLWNHNDSVNAAPCEENNGITDSFTKLDQTQKDNAGSFAGEPKRSRKLWNSNDSAGLRREPVNLVKDSISAVEVEHIAPCSVEVPFFEERATYQEPTDYHLEQCPGVASSLERHDDGMLEAHMNNIPAKVHAAPEMSSSVLEDCISEGQHDNKNHSDASVVETTVLGNFYQDKLKLPCTDEMLCTSALSQIVQEHPNIPNIDEIKETQVKVSDKDSHEAYEKEKLFDFVDEAFVRNKKERANEVTLEPLIHEETIFFGIEGTADACEGFQEGYVDRDAGSPENESNIASESANANENEDAESLNVLVSDDILTEPNVRTCGTYDKDPCEYQESLESLGPRDLENRMDIIEDVISHGKEKEAKESLLENVEKTLVKELLNHDIMEGQRSMTSINEMPELCANAMSDRDCNTFHSVSDNDDDSDDAIKMKTWSNNLQASFSEACTRMQHLFRSAECSSSEKAGKSAPVLENLVDEDCREAYGEIPTNKCTTLEEAQKTRGKIEERDSDDNIPKVGLEDQQSFYLNNDTIPKFAEDTVSDIVQKSRDENLDVQRTKGRDNVNGTEGEIEKEAVLARLDEEEKKKSKIEKEKEQDTERLRRELEEEKEREMERAKDRLAVQRATREEHDRAFAEARAKAERIALERITSARQRASAEAREKEEKRTAEAAAEKASRETRMKAERAAVERATSEARERAIEKAKAAADAKERMERFRSSFKDSSKVTNQDNQQESQFQKTASFNCGRSMDSCNEVVEIELALRHKAILERHQRTAERAAKALAEKSMRDMLAQREQAERHRLAEFLDPEVKRWSNGKEGNLRALLSTLQYILGSDSGWQSVPLTDLITAAGVKKAYRRATLCVHPDKLQQRGATIRQKYICEKVFDLLKEAWNKFNSGER